MNADQLLVQHIAEVDQIICDGAVQMAQQLLDAGASVDDLSVLMRPIVQELAKRRAAAVAKLRANADRMRVVEAQIERLKSGVMCIDAGFSNLYGRRRRGVPPVSIEALAPSVRAASHATPRLNVG